MSDEETTITTRGIDRLIKLFGESMPTVKIGILAQKVGRDGKANNAEIGVVHEFGSLARNIPERSFLRMPIQEHLEERLEGSQAFDADVLAEAVANSSFIPYMRKIAAICENIVSDAFATGGFGKWPKSNMLRKKNHQTLVETQQLRNSITSEVKE